jgi:Putative adhesin
VPHYDFDRTTPVLLALQMHHGAAFLTAEEASGIQVEISGLDDRDTTQQAVEGWTVTLEGDTLTVRAPEQSGWQWRRSPKPHVAVRMPAGSSVSARMGAADLQAAGDYGALQAGLASGDASVERVAGDAQFKAASGDLTVDGVGGSLRMHSGSGDLRIGDVTGDVAVESASGDISIGRVGGSVQARTASGDIDVGRLSRGEAVFQSASGDVTVGVAAGTGVWLDLNTASGSTTSDLTMGGEAAQQTGLQLRVRTASGDIHVRRAMGDLAQGVV